MQKNKEFEKVVKRMAGYIYTCAHRFEHNSQPYDRNDFIQTAKMAIWETIKTSTDWMDIKDSYWKKVIHSRMKNFHRDCVRKVNKAERAYKDACFEDCTPDFSDDVIMKVTLEEYNENTKET